MPISIKMPALSPTMKEGKLAKWLVKVGDKVASGDIMAEIETDKATMEFEAVDEGTIASLDVAGGTDNVEVGTVIATLAGDDEDAAPPAKTETPKADAPQAEAPKPEAPKGARSKGARTTRCSREAGARPRTGQRRQERSRDCLAARETDRR